MACFAAGTPDDAHWAWTAAGLLAVPALVALNGFFVAAEFALVAVRRTRIEELVNQGTAGARSALDAVAHLDRTIAALKVCAGHIARHDVAHVRAVVTQAGRLAKNADVLVARARDEAGIALEVISAEEEAALAAAGCAPLIGKDYKGALVFDIGGGSTEIILLDRDQDKVSKTLIASVPVGVVSLAEESQGRGFAALRTLMAERFAPFVRRTEAHFDPRSQHLLGTSGTVTTLAAIALGLPRYNRARVDASWHRTARLLSVVEDLADKDANAIAAIGSIGPERADLMLPGCAIFAAICTLWMAPMLRVADRGLRDGMLRQLVEYLL